MEIGKIAPGFHEGEETRIWRCPIQVFVVNSGKELKVYSVYEDDGVLCIDVEVEKEEK